MITSNEIEELADYLFDVCGFDDDYVDYICDDVYAEGGLEGVIDELKDGVEVVETIKQRWRD